jgi:sulfur carrier protein ThiS
MSLRVRFVGLHPVIEPSEPEEGWYSLVLQKEVPIEEILRLFGVQESGISVLKNGVSADLKEGVKNGDEVLVVIMVLGG